nr:TetR family transcriptional regulator [Nocardia bovistercoris]
MVAALKCFAAEGIAATSLRSVATAAQVSIGLVQHHFGTKSGLVTAVNEFVLGVVADGVAARPLPAPPADTFGEIGHRVCSIMIEHPEVVDYLARAFVDGDDLAHTIFDGLVAISAGQWDQLADHGLLRPDIDRTWAALHPLILVLGTVMLRRQIERHLPAPLADPEQLDRWDGAVAELLRGGLLSDRPTEGE